MRKYFLKLLCTTYAILLMTGCVRLDLFESHSLGEVAPEAWSQLKVGMTKQEVVGLLGESLGKSGPTRLKERGLALVPEHWEYGFGGGLSSFSPSPKSHVVYFGEDERVLSFRGPREDKGEYDYEDIGALRIGSDSLESIADRKEGPKSATLKPPVPLAPADRSVFQHYPREIVLRWKPAPDTPFEVQYYVQTDFTTKGDVEVFGEWDGDSPMFTERTGKTSMNYRHFGAQPGRWRVKVFDKSGESEWCAWQYFRFTQ